MSLRSIVKRLAQGIAIAVAFPSALVCFFGRSYPAYQFFSHLWALGPGLPGNLLRAAFYKLTLCESSMDVTISFGALLIYPSVRIGPMVSIGNFCVVGRARIGARTQIASGVHIPSGRHEHTRDAEGRLSGLSGCEVVIGSDCWIGSSAIIMATVGDGSTVGAGSVVVKPIPARSVAVGNPAFVVRSAATQETPA
jgi:acetyltransferase-like isoleucine patch superfamily enzyme